MYYDGDVKDDANFRDNNGHAMQKSSGVYDSIVAGAGANGDNGVCEDRDTIVNVAKECLLPTAKADPKGAHVWSNLANAYYMAGDHQIHHHSGKFWRRLLSTHY
ncbi:tetratricopeptide repeat (TPR)-containing protein [Artemisia annua]|uniref:Tetratricopeptide repeat (TPR)-containing protein n=1 Tax=Artemisia annua TaxID=35608 RepID=A0A2U1PFX7_ARTAN|nr:tetratricopeptide repeat (TPR)-containing protein [Artemisia annua]